MEDFFDQMKAGAKPLEDIRAGWPRTRDLLAKADVIFGFDADGISGKGGGPVLFWGRKTFNRLAAGHAVKPIILAVKYRSLAPTDLEQLIAAVRVVKGSCDYQADPGLVDRLCDQLFAPDGQHRHGGLA